MTHSEQRCAAAEAAAAASADGAAAPPATTTTAAVAADRAQRLAGVTFEPDCAAGTSLSAIPPVHRSTSGASDARHLTFTPPVCFAVPDDLPQASTFSLDANAHPTSPCDGGPTPPHNSSIRGLSMLPEQIERWAHFQQTMHEEAPTFNFVLQPETNAAKKWFGIFVFLMTQGSGKDKVFKLAQNAAALANYYAAVGESKAFWTLTEGQLSRSRKVLRTFKIFSEVNKIVCNTEENPLTRFLMRAGHVHSIFYFLFDHVLGLIELRIMQTTERTTAAVKWWKNIFSTVRLLIAFMVDTLHYRMGLKKEADLKRDLEDLASPAAPADTSSHALHEERVALRTDLKAVYTHRGVLRRNFAGNIINMVLLLSSLGARPFSRLTLNYVALGGIITALLGIYKVWEAKGCSVYRARTQTTHRSSAGLWTTSLPFNSAETSANWTGGFCAALPHSSLFFSLSLLQTGMQKQTKGRRKPKAKKNAKNAKKNTKQKQSENSRFGSKRVVSKRCASQNSHPTRLLPSSRHTL